MSMGHTTRLLVLLALLALTALPGCSSNTASSSDASVPNDAAARDASDLVDADTALDADIDAIVEEVDPTVLTNFSFDAAKHIEVSAQGVLQPLESADQVDYYAFEAEAGEVYVIKTNRGRFTPDNVIALYSPDRELLAENDMGWVWPNDLVDARLVVRTEESGTYFVVVEDRVLPPEVFQFDDVPTFFYRVSVDHVARGSAGFGWEAEDADDTAMVAFTDDEGSGVAYVTLVGELHEGEVDLFELQGRVAQALIGHVLPGGVPGNGSTLRTGVVGIRDASDHLVAQIDRSLGTEAIHPPIDDATYTLSVEATEELGDNAFYAIDLVLLAENPQEAETDNDTPEAAQPLLLEGGFFRRGTILASLPADDVDYFSFEAMAGETMEVICEGHSAGSGVRELKAELRNADDEVLGEATEVLNEGLSLEQVPAEVTGSYYLRLSSETPDDAEAAPAWARCAVVSEL